MKQLFWLLLLIPAVGYAQPSLCTVTGTVYTPDGDTAKGAIITVVKAVKGGVLISKQAKDYRADKNGSITLLLHRGSTTWLYGEIAGMDSLGKAGVPVVVPDNPTATLSTLVNTSVPPRYTVLIGSAADTAYSVRITHPSIPGFTAANAADTNKVLYVDENGNIKETWKGGGGTAIDTSGTFALTVAQAALPKADTTALHAQKFATPTPHYVSLAPQSTVTHQEGRFYYDSDTDALTVYNAETDVALQVGEENWVRARNNTGAIISNGKVVYISGAIGQNPTIALARADAAATSCVIGVATHDIGVNEIGYVTTHGLVNDLNLTNYGDGSEVWLSADSAGLFTLNKPTANGHRKILIGHVAYSHGTLGKLLVQIREPEDLDRYAAFADADSVHAVLDTLGNFALSVAQSAAVEADTAGNFALSVAQGATVTANAALPKSDTTALHAQKFKNLEDAIGGKGDSDSLSTTTATANAALAKSDTTNQVRVTHPTIAGLASADTNQVIGMDASGNLIRRWDNGGATINGVTSSTFKIPSLILDTTGTGGYWQAQDSGYVHRDSVQLSPTVPGKAYRIHEIKYRLYGSSIWSKHWMVQADSTNNCRVLDITIDQRMFRDPLQVGNVYGTQATWKANWLVNGATLNNAAGNYFDFTEPFTVSYSVRATVTATLYSWIFYAQAANSETVWMDVTIKVVIPVGSASLWYAQITNF